MNTFTFSGTWVIGETISFRYGNSIYTYTITSATIAVFLPLLVAAYNALASADYPQFSEQTAASPSGSTLSLTADVPGKPFAATISTNSAAGLINGAASSTGTATVASAGPNDISTAANWSGGVIPVNGDTIYVDPDAAYDLLYSLDALAAVTTLVVNYTGAVKTGLPSLNTDGTSYPEYRPTYLQTAGGTVNLGGVSGSQAFQGTARFKMDAGSAQATWNVYLTAQGQDANLEAALLKGTHASNALNVLGQSQVGFAVFGGESGALATLKSNDGAFVRLGAGVSTLTNVQNDGGAIEVNSAVGTALTHSALAGTTTVNGTGAVAQLTALGGTVVYNTTGTLGGATVLMNGALLDASQGQGTVTVTNPIDCYSGADVDDPKKRLNGSGSLIIDYNGGGPLESLGANYRLTRSAVA